MTITGPAIFSVVYSVLLRPLPWARADRLVRFTETHAGATRETPLSIDKGEVTDKGSINQRAVLEHRGALIDELYAASPPDRVISVT